MKTGEGLTVLRLRWGELEVTGCHRNRQFELQHRPRRLGHIQRAEAASDDSRWRDSPKLRGARGGIGPVGCLVDNGSLDFGFIRRKREKMVGGGRGVIGRQWRVIVCWSVHIEAAGCTTGPFDLSVTFFFGLLDNVQTAAHTARPQGRRLLCIGLSSSGSHRQFSSGYNSWSIFVITKV